MEANYHQFRQREGAPNENYVVQGPAPVLKDSYFEIFLLSGESVAGHILGGKRSRRAIYGGYGDLMSHTERENIDNVEIEMNRINHSVSIANYGDELFTCS